MQSPAKRHFLLILFLFVTLSLFYAPQVFSQEEAVLNFDKAYKDYETQIEAYRDTHEDYILRRSQYLRFGTLKSQQDAQEATAKMLQARDDVLIAYLISLRERLKETKGVDDARKQGLILRIEEEIGWFKDHKEKVPSAGTLEDLVEDSDDAKLRYNTIEPLFYEVLATNSSGKLTDVKERLKDTFSALKDKVEEIKKEEREGYAFSSRKIQILDRWVLESENRIIRADEKQVEAEETITTFVSLRLQKSLLVIYNDAIEKLVESQQFSKEASSFMKEIVREIKTAEE